MKNRLSRHAQIAFDDPCFEAEETEKPKFGWIQDFQGQRAVLRLTVNRGLE